MESAASEAHALEHAKPELRRARQLVQKTLADMQTEIALGFEGALALGRLLDQGT